MSSSSIKRSWKFNNLFTSRCGCRQTPATTAVVEPKLRLRRCSSSASSVERRSGTSTTFSPNTNTDTSPRMISPCPKINDSVAVEKTSDDPYGDFRRSMVEMITEKEMYSRSDLQQLLRCFLDLNPPHHHEVIVRAFMDVWKGGEVTAPPCSAA